MGRENLLSFISRESTVLGRYHKGKLLHVPSYPGPRLSAMRWPRFPRVFAPILASSLLLSKHGQTPRNHALLTPDTSEAQLFLR